MSLQKHDIGPGDASALKRQADDLIISQDKLRGCEEIAEFLGENLQRVKYMVRHGLLPVGKEGTSKNARVIASRRVLRRHYLAAVGGEAA